MLYNLYIIDNSLLQRKVCEVIIENILSSK